MLDKIPLFIYYKDIQANTIDATGRNSLCLAPTILDYLDISSSNYFLGTSLFGKKPGSLYETVFHCLGTMYSTEGAEIQPLDKEEQNKMTRNLAEYFTLSNHEKEIYLTIEYLNDESKVKLIVHNAEDLSNIWLPTWSEENGQDDIVWYSADKNEDGTWSCMINREKMETYAVHVYAGSNEPETKLLEYIIV